MHIVLTGASSGIGAALARRFAKDGHRLSLVARRGAVLEELAEALNVPCRVVQQDLSSFDPRCSWLDRCVTELGEVDMLVNNAGVQVIDKVSEVGLRESEQLHTLNYRTPVALMRAILPSMRRRERGTIVNIGSLAGLVPAPYMADYCASKAALGAFSESLRGELKGTGINVLTAYPGPVDTPLGQRGYERLGHRRSAMLMPLGNSEEFAELLLAAMQRRSARVIYPKSYLGAWWAPAVLRGLISIIGAQPPVGERQRMLGVS